jgi:hypothetical protein
MKNVTLKDHEIKLLGIAIENQIFEYQKVLEGPGANPQATKDKINTLENLLGKMSKKVKPKHVQAITLANVELGNFLTELWADHRLEWNELAYILSDQLHSLHNTNLKNQREEVE